MPDDMNLNRAQAVAALPEMVALAEWMNQVASAKDAVIEAVGHWQQHRNKAENPGNYDRHKWEYEKLNLEAAIQYRYWKLEILLDRGTPTIKPDPDATQPSQATAALEPGKGAAG